ncbi:hypothetical protein C8F01DRAFT_442172 [Mycena amicta]|nr:hypothetical protein C8F01DRAFT_442172 [Mycena amicta]
MSSISPPANDAQPPSSTSHAPQKPPAPELPQQTTSAHGLLSPWSSTVSSRVPSPLQDNPNTDNPDEPAPPSKPKDQQSRVDGGGALSLDSVHPDESVGDLFAGLDDEDSDERDGDDDDEEEEDDKEDKEDKDPESEDEEHWLDVASVNAEAVDFSGIIPARNRPKEKKATGYRAAQKVRKQSNEDLDEAVAEFERRARARAKKFAERAAKKFDKRVTEVESKMAGAKQWHKTRGINLANAKTSWYMKGVNAKRIEANKKPITLPRAQRRISKNPKLVEMTPEQEAQLVEVLQAQRDLKATGSRGTALGEGRDYLETVKQVSTELSNVAARTNAAVLLVISPTQPGAIGEPVALGINGGAEFALVKFKKSEVVLAHEFRAFVENLSPGSLQARIRGMKTADVAERARQHIKDGLDNIVGHATRMFYTPAYFKTIVQGHGVYLHGYPVGVPWASPKEFTSRPVTEKLLTALESGACSWRKVKNAGHEEKIKKDWEELTGSVAECAPRKRRNDVGGTHERKRGTGKRGRDGNGDETEAEETVAQRRNKRKQRSKATIEDEDEDEQEDEDVTPPRKKAKSSARVHDTDDDDDDDVNPPRKKAKEPKSSAQVHNTDDEEDEGVNETVKAKRKGGMVDGKRPAKKVKKSKEGDEEVKTKRKGGEVDPKGPTEKVKKTKEPKKKNTVKGSRRGPPGVRDG